jgi:hypothetical protein
MRPADKKEPQANPAREQRRDREGNEQKGQRRADNERGGNGPRDREGNEARGQRRADDEREGNGPREHDRDAKGRKADGPQQAQPRPAAPQPPKNPLGLKSISLCICEVACVKDTAELGGGDEMVFEGITVAAEVSEEKKPKGKAKQGARLSIGKIKSGEVRRYPSPPVIARIPIGDERLPWPRVYMAAFVPIELDGKNTSGALLAQIIEKLDATVEKAAAEGMATLAATAGAILAVGAPVPLVAVAAAAVAVAAKLTFGEIKRAQQEDIFEPMMVDEELSGYPKAHGELPGSRKTVSFSGFKGIYRVTYCFKAE